MCIIAYIPQGKQIKETTIRYMFEGNPDGAGIMWKPKDNAPVEIRKGFMDVEELIKAYYDIPQNCEKAIHCRIATSGRISVACCHPFPVRAKTNAMREASDNATVALMHNGIINYTTPSKGMASDYSDTMLFASKVLYPLQKQLNEWHIQTLIENSTTSRLLIFRQDGEALVLGDWKFEDGIYYSNGNYKEDAYSGFYGGYGNSYNYGWKKGYVWDWKLGKYVPPAKKDTTTEKKFKNEESVKSVATLEQEVVDEPVDDGYSYEEEDDYEPYYEYYLTVPEDDTEDEMQREQAVYEALVNAGFGVEDITTDEYMSNGYLIRSMQVITRQPLPESIVEIAGYYIEE